MTRILALDTSSRHRALCVLAARDSTLLDYRPLPARDLDRALPPALAQLLTDDLSAVACVLGPGSYTGLRVGIASALGIAHARALPLYGIAALDVVALTAPAATATVTAVADAGRGALYVATYRRDGATLQLADGPHRVDAAHWSPAPGAVTFDDIPGVAASPPEAAPNALARAAAAALASTPLAFAGLEPIYLSGSAQPEGGRV